MAYLSRFTMRKAFQMTAISIALTLAGCGGGGDGVDLLPPTPDLGAPNTLIESGQGDDAKSTSPLVNISDIQLFDRQGNMTSTITALGAIAQVKVVNDMGEPIAGALVTFEGQNIGFDTSNGSVVTDQNGRAQVTVTPTENNDTGSYSLQASVEYRGETASSNTYYYTVKVSRPNPKDPQEVSPVVVDTLAVYGSNGQLTRTVTNQGATARIRVVNESGQPIGGALVTFASEGVIFSAGNGSVVTNSSGEATVGLKPATTNDTGSYQLSATVNVNGTVVTSDDYNITVQSVTSSVSGTDLYEIYTSTSKANMITGSDSEVLTIRVTDRAGGVLANVPVSLSIIDSRKYGLSFDANSEQVTNEQGLITIGIIQSDISTNAQLDHNADILVTVNDGTNKVETQTVNIEVSGTQIVNPTLSKTVIGKGDTVDFSGRLVDGTGSAVDNVPIVLVNGNYTKTGTTNRMGQFVFSGLKYSQLKAVDGKFNFDIIANPDGEVTQTFSNVATITELTSRNVILEYKDIVVKANGNILVTVLDGAGEPITLSTTRGNFSNNRSVQTLTLNAQNQATFVIRADTPGIATIQSTYDGETETNNILFVSVAPTNLFLQADTPQLAVNSSTAIEARVLDASDAPVANAVIEASVVKDGSGGRLSNGIIRTDANGIATLTYTAGSNPTAVDGVQINARVSGVVLPSGSISPVDIQTSVNLTVQTRASTIAFALSDRIGTDSSNVYYYRNGSASVTNNSGLAAKNQPVTVALRPKAYYKGFFDIGLTDESRETDTDEKTWIQTSKPFLPLVKTPIYKDEFPIASECPNEDLNFNSILDPGEDLNNDGELQPGFVATILVDGQVVSGNNGVFRLTTDDTGRIDFRIRYFKQYANWMTMDMVASTLVDGSEAKQSRPISFPVLVDDIDLNKKIRPNMESPFGRYSDCTDAR